REVVDVYLAALVDRADHEFRAGLFAYELPRHDVRMVFEVRDENLVAWSETRAAPALRDEVDGGGRPTGEDDFRSRGRVDEGDQRIARTFVGFRRAMAERMHAAVYVRVVGALVLCHFLDDALGLLR